MYCTKYSLLFSDLTGWLWAVLMNGSIAIEADVRTLYEEMLPHCKSVFSGKARTVIARNVGIPLLTPLMA
jgi:hypothetical protein